LSVYQSNRVGVALIDVKGEIHLQNDFFHSFSKSTVLDLVGLINTASTRTKCINVQDVSFFLQCIPVQKILQSGIAYVILASRNEEDGSSAPLVKQYYQAFIDNTFEFIFFTDSQDKIAFSNRLFNLKFGSVPSVGWRIADIFENESQYHELKETLLAQGRVSAAKVFFNNADGTRLTGLVNAQLLRSENNDPLINWTVLDVSDRMEFEERMQAKNDQLAKLNYQMEKFVYSTSHDLRSPLTTILGLGNLLRLDTRDRNVLDYADKIEVSANRLDKIIRDILSFSRATYQNEHVQEIRWLPVVNSVIENHRSHPHFDRIAIDTHVDGDAVFYLDATRLEIILDSLIGNAIHYTDVNKTRSFVHIKIALTVQEAVISVHDNGIGIHRQFFDQIFHMFFKASILSKGAGLGLYLAKESITQLNGSIQVESEVGFGSVFTVRLPNSAKGKLINRKILLQTHGK